MLLNNRHGFQTRVIFFFIQPFCTCSYYSRMANKQDRNLKYSKQAGIWSQFLLSWLGRWLRPSRGQRWRKWEPEGNGWWLIIMPRPEMEGWITLPTKAMILFHTTLAEFEAGNYGWLESDFPTLLEQSRMQYWQSQYDIRYIKILIYRNISTFFQFCHYAIARKNWTGSGGYNWCREIWQGSIKYVGLTWSRAGGVPHGLVPAPWDGMFRKQMDSRRSCRIRPVRSSPSPCKEITRTSSEPGITINHIQFSCSLGKQTSSH